MKCSHCKKEIDFDEEEDLIHLHLENKGVDARMCEPNNPNRSWQEYIVKTTKGVSGGKEYVLKSSIKNFEKKPISRKGLIYAIIRSYSAGVFAGINEWIKK